MSAVRKIHVDLICIGFQQNTDFVGVLEELRQSVSPQAIGVLL